MYVHYFVVSKTLERQNPLYQDPPKSLSSFIQSIDKMWCTLKALSIIFVWAGLERKVDWKVEQRPDFLKWLISLDLVWSS